MNNFRTSLKRLEIRFDAPFLSSDAGLLALKKLDARLGLTKRLSRCIHDPRKGVVEHTVEKMLAQRVYGIALGWEDCNDFDSDGLGKDVLYSLCLEAEPASQPTLSRFENWVDRRDLHGLSACLVDLFITRHKDNPPKRIVIDMDATDDPTHGQQEFEFYHGYYGCHCYLPLVGFCSCDGGDEDLVCAVLRPGNAHAGRRSASILRRLVSKLKEALPLTEFVFRGDAGFAFPEMYETCEDLGISYLISLPKNDRLLKMASSLMKQAKQERERAQGKARVFGALEYKAGSWIKSRRVIAKAEAMEKGENPRFVVTNLSGDPESVYNEYCLRGDCENRIKELKLDLSSGRTSCHRFAANCFRLLLHAIAFILLSEFRRLLSGTGFERSTMSQIRLKLLKLGAFIEQSTRRILVRLPRGHPHRHLLERLMA